MYCLTLETYKFCPFSRYLFYFPHNIALLWQSLLFYECIKERWSYLEYDALEVIWLVTKVLEGISCLKVQFKDKVGLFHGVVGWILSYLHFPWSLNLILLNIKPLYSFIGEVNMTSSFP